MADTEARHLLVLCTGNSARSILAEALFKHLGRGRIVAHSAGSQPKGQVHPLALSTLEEAGLPTAGLRSKSWDEFAAGAQPPAPPLSFVITVCDNAAGEVCPLWPGQPMLAHWGLPDPAAVTGPPEAQRKAFHDTLLALRRRIEIMLALPMDALDRMALEREVRAIGRQG